MLIIWGFFKAQEVNAVLLSKLPDGFALMQGSEGSLRLLIGTERASGTSYEESNFEMKGIRSFHLKPCPVCWDALQRAPPTNLDHAVAHCFEYM